MTADITISTGNIPAEPNSFIGRERDLTELARILAEARALTLCGPGGIGKTRLAVRLAADLEPGVPDGAWLVELADTAEPGLVPARVAAAVGIRDEPDRPLAETLAAALRPRTMLLILDTCEHLVDACAALVQVLLASCPSLRVIATSREPLRVRGETVWRVPPLSLPGPPGRGSAADLASCEAVRLFTDRAAAARPGFSLDDANAEAVARLCRTLDGVPLAIELAAARVRALSAEQIAVRLADRFQLLASGDRTAPPRQQTLRATVDWSYDLLSEAEQTLLRRLSVFAGWNLEMAEQVCADAVIPAEGVLDLLAALIDKSLVALDAEMAGDARYRLLDTIREYAADRLAASGEEMATRLAHRDYLLRLAEGIVAVAYLRGDPPWRDRVAMIHRVAVERANFAAALALCLERGEAEEGLRLCWPLRGFWVAHGDVAEGIGWLDRFLAPGLDAPPGVRARGLGLRAELAFEQQDYRVAGERAQAGLDLCRTTGCTGEAISLRVLALVSLRAGRHEEALARIDAAVATAHGAAEDWEEGLALSSRAAIIARQGRLNEAQRAFETALDVLRDNNGWGIAATLYGLGDLARARRDPEAALRHFQDALALYRDIGARPEIARCLAGIGWVALSQRDLDLAGPSLADSLRLSLATGQRLAVARGLEGLAIVAVADGDPARATRLQGAALALRESIGYATSPTARAHREDVLEAARRALGAPAVAALLAEGRELSTQEVASLAVEGVGQPGAAGPRAGGPGDSGPDSVGGAPGLDSGAARAPVGTVSGPGVPGAAPGLTAREREIAVLVARGLSNRAIADELVISPATAARHVANIFTKLGLRSRAQLAAWAAERGLRDQG